jgi:hypothetical protein
LISLSLAAPHQHFMDWTVIGQVQHRLLQSRTIALQLNCEGINEEKRLTKKASDRWLLGVAAHAVSITAPLSFMHRKIFEELCART